MPLYPAIGSRLLYSNITAGTPLADSSTLTDVSAAYALPTRECVAGRVLRFTAFGVFSNTGTPNFNVGVYWGGVAGTALAAGVATATASGVTNVPWRLELTSIIRTISATGTVMSQGFWHLGTTVAAVTTLPLPGIALAEVTIATNAGANLTVGAKWGTQNAANTATLHGFTVEAL